MRLTSLLTTCKKSPYFQLAFVVSVLICFLPLLPGIAGLLLSAFTFIPALEHYQLSLLGFEQLFSWPGIHASIFITLLVTLSSTLFTTVIAFSILQSCWHRPYWKKIESLIAPILALPHVAFAVGFAFLFSTSGFIARIYETVFINEAFTSLQIINNRYGLGLIIALTIKEIPFILFMSIALLKQLNVEQTMKLAQSLGYSRREAWQKIIFPQWLPKIRFSLFAIMAYSLSVVDVTLILGPTNPPTLPVLLWQWLNDADLQSIPKASAGALLLLSFSITLVYLIRFIEWLVIKRYQSWQTNGRFSLISLGKLAVLLTYVVSIATFLILIIWSFAQRWPFPNTLPTQWTTTFWQQEWLYLLDVTKTSITLAISSATIALLLALIIHEYKSKSDSSQTGWSLPQILIAIPILAPQLSLLFGIQISSLYIANQHYYLWVLWTHVFFAFPYLYLVLDGPWHSYDKRLNSVALSLGLSPLKVWWKIKMPILLPAILIAWAVAVSVSLAQYLPTLMLGAGRISTLTTEAVALASGQDRRISAIYALLQSLLPALFFILAILIGRNTGQLDNRTKRFNYHDIDA